MLLTRTTTSHVCNTCVTPALSQTMLQQTAQAHLTLCCSQQQSTAQHNAAMTETPVRSAAAQTHSHQPPTADDTSPGKARYGSKCSNMPSHSTCCCHSHASLLSGAERYRAVQAPAALFNAPSAAVPHARQECNTQQSNILPSSSHTRDATAQQMRISCKHCGSAQNSCHSNAGHSADNSHHTAVSKAPLCHTLLRSNSSHHT
jgi:hypothetical protein